MKSTMNAQLKLMLDSSTSVQASKPNRIIKPGGLKKRLISTIRAAVRTSEVAHTCEWLVSEGYASDLTHAGELVNSAFYE